MPTVTTTSSIKVHCAHTELVALSELKPHPKNPNRHPIEQITMLARIIKETGWRNPIVVSKNSGYITKGHARFSAAQMLETPKVPVDYQKYANEQEEIADMLADNRIAELAETDQAMLQGLLASFPAEKIDLTGYAITDLVPEAQAGPDLKTALANFEARLEALDTKKPPNSVWLLVNIPFDKWGQVRSHVEALQKTADITCQTSRAE